MTLIHDSLKKSLADIMGKNVDADLTRILKTDEELHNEYFGSQGNAIRPVAPADSITMQHILDAKKAMEAQMIKKMQPPPEPPAPTEEEMTRTAEILTEVVMLLHAGDWRAAQQKMLSQGLHGLRDVAVIDVKFKDLHSDHFQDAARYGRAVVDGSVGRANATATEIQMRQEAAQQQLSAMHRALVDQMTMQTRPMIVPSNFLKNIKS